MKKQFVVDSKGKRVGVILPIRKYEQLMEEFIDARLYDAVKNGNGAFISLDEYIVKRKTKPGTRKSPKSGV